MDFSAAIKSGFDNYIIFSARAALSEYWYWQLLMVLVAIAAGLIDLAIFGDSSPINTNTIAGLALFLPTWAVTIRRLHDLDRSGWWSLLMLVPLIGWFWLLFWFCTRGTVGSNRFGPDPLQDTTSAAA
jgi:uncharacterized membrane protein YhaH (DUF805 family)